MATALTVVRLRAAARRRSGRSPHGLGTCDGALEGDARPERGRGAAGRGPVRRGDGVPDPVRAADDGARGDAPDGAPLATAGTPDVSPRRAGDPSADRGGTSGDRRGVHVHELRRRGPGAPRGRATNRTEARARRAWLAMRFEGIEDTGVLPEIPPAEPGVLLDVRGPGPDDRLRRGMGSANIATDTPISDDAIFYVGSLAKQFVAACVALLARDGSLDLNEPIATYVPGLPPWGDRVHVLHLIHHTAGLPRVYRPSGGIDPSGVPGWGNEELMEEIRTIPDSGEEAGTRHLYTGDGYLLLAEAIAQAAGAPLANVARERLFEPLAMHDSFFRDAETELPARAARGH